jgi:hypothetical protein
LGGQGTAPSRVLRFRLVLLLVLPPPPPPPLLPFIVAAAATIGARSQSLGFFSAGCRRRRARQEARGATATEGFFAAVPRRFMMSHPVLYKG